MPDLRWNFDFWSSLDNWTSGGEEWSEAWGGSEAQWFGAIYPRIHRFLPASAILEIAPGFGRWTKFLLPACKRYVGVDLSAESVKACREAFRDFPHAAFEQNDGRTLAMAPDGGFDFVFSFDSLVHVEMDVLQGYIRQVLKKLSPQGAAVLHHSNLLPFAGSLGDAHTHARARSVSADLAADAIRTAGGRLLIQERVNWGGTVLHDCITTFCRGTSAATTPPVIIDNPSFMQEADNIRRNQSAYSRVLIPGA